MYLSWLLINVGDNPDRPRPGRLWLRNLYHVHQRLCMAFPSAPRTSDDADFLQPFEPEDFGARQVHVARRSDAGFLFRIDPQPGSRVVILVQSAVKPDWDYAFRNASHLLAARPETRQFAPGFAKDQRLRFRLVANPTRKVDTKSGPDGHRRNGRRLSVPPDRFDEWLTRRAQLAGFVVERLVSVRPGYVYVAKGDADQRRRLRSVRYDGILNITDPARFRETLVRGIGSGKGFGFGLLSVAPAA